MLTVSSRRAPVDRIEVSVYTIPTDFPESDGTLGATRLHYKNLQGFTFSKLDT